MWFSPTPFKDSIDFIDLIVVGQTDYNLLSNLGYSTMEVSKSNHIYLLSERGYAKHLAKIGNIRQRGDIGGSAKKVGKRIKELERLYGIEHGNNQHTSLPNNSVSSQSDLATQLGISVDTLQNYKMLADMIPELEELVDSLSIRIKSSTTTRTGAVGITIC